VTLAGAQWLCAHELRRGDVLLGYDRRRQAVELVTVLSSAGDNRVVAHLEHGREVLPAAQHVLVDREREN